jgi:hypothetical protein
MAMTIFFVLNGLGVAFLLYVLANFWKEGRQAKNDAGKHAAKFAQRNWADVLVVTHPISHAAQGGVSVIAFPSRREETREKTYREELSRGTEEFPARRISNQ